MKTAIGIIMIWHIHEKYHWFSAIPSLHSIMPEVHFSFFSFPYKDYSWFIFWLWTSRHKIKSKKGKNETVIFLLYCTVRIFTLFNANMKKLLFYVILFDSCHFLKDPVIFLFFPQFFFKKPQKTWLSQARRSSSVTYHLNILFLYLLEEYRKIELWHSKQYHYNNLSLALELVGICSTLDTFPYPQNILLRTKI